MRGPRKRSRLDIVLDVLEAINQAGELNPTRISLRVNLSYDRVKRVLDDLLRRGLIEVIPSDERHGSTLVRLTQKGRQLLVELRRLKRILEDYGLL